MKLLNALGTLLIIAASCCLVASSWRLWAVGDKAVVILENLIWGFMLIALFGQNTARIIARMTQAGFDWLYWRMVHFGNVMVLQWRVVAGVTLIMGVLTTASSFAVCPIYSSTCTIKTETDIDGFGY